jgi:dimethylaniline monooxygenase (N-oxide forming)
MALSYLPHLSHICPIIKRVLCLTITAVFFCKSARSLPYMSAKYRSNSFWYRLRAFFINVPIKDTHGRIIDVTSWPEKVDEEGVMHFKPRKDEPQDVSHVKPDIVVFATGYRRTVRFLGDSYPQPTDVTVRAVYSPDDVSVGFIGFTRPSFGEFPTH